MSETCGTCRFWSESGREYATENWPYACQRHAPVANPMQAVRGMSDDTLWPKTTSTQWCGDYERQPDPLVKRDSRTELDIISLAEHLENERLQGPK